MNSFLRFLLPRKLAPRAMEITLVAALALSPAARAIDIVFDYTYDTTGFFTANPNAKVDLEAAAQAYEMKLGDTLSAIAPSGSNTWTADFFNPSTLADVSVSNPTIAQNAILVFVGSASLGTGVLGQGGPGGFSANASFFNTVEGRGQAGALASTPTDYSTWGGALAFSNSATWYFDANPGTKESFAGKNDFYSVAVHELGHLLGIGTADSWSNTISNGEFTGAASEAVFGGAVPTDAGGGHWASGTMSTIYGTTTSQETVMDPSLTTGTRKLLTTLDVAGLQDIGWMIVPEPSTLALMGGVLALGLCPRRRRTS